MYGIAVGENTQAKVGWPALATDQVAPRLAVDYLFLDRDTTLRSECVYNARKEI